MEPNPLLKDRLDALELCYNKLGWKVLIMRHALSNRDGDVVPMFVGSQAQNNLWESAANLDGKPVISYAVGQHSRYVNVTTKDAYTLVMDAA